MFVFQHKASGKYVKRYYQTVFSSHAETYEHVNTLAEASVLAGWWEVAEWIRRRESLGFGPLPAEWQIVEVQPVSQPKIEVVKVIG